VEAGHLEELEDIRIHLRGIMHLMEKDATPKFV
jgi:type I restriction enzyme R subunit